MPCEIRSEVLLFSPSMRKTFRSFTSGNTYSVEPHLDLTHTVTLMNPVICVSCVAIHAIFILAPATYLNVSPCCLGNA